MKIERTRYQSEAGAVILSLALSFCSIPAAAETDMTADPAAAGEQEAETELTVFAAASMTETLTEIAESYRKEHPEVSISFNFDSSGTLETQILQGAECDVFVSAAQKQMNELDGKQEADTNPDGNDLLLPGSRIDLLENKVALAVPEGNPKGIQCFDDLAERLAAASGQSIEKAGAGQETEPDKTDADSSGQNADQGILLAMGNSDVPVGQYTEKILDYYGISEDQLAEAGCITYGTNVKEVTTQISEASVDCGIIYQTDAFSEGLTVVDTAAPDMCGQVIYPAAVLKGSRHEEAAETFLEYLRSEKAQDIFEKVGFTAITDDGMTEEVTEMES